MLAPIIAILGGGVYVPRLAELLSATVPPGELRLWARDSDRLRLVAEHAQASIAAHGWRVTAADALSACVEGADVVVPLIRIGNLAARAHDESFPTAFGLTGDEGLGPGGFANAFRTIPALTVIARELKARCPNAWVCNLMAPLGITTRLFIDTGLRALGICELPLVTLEALVRPAMKIDFQYAGLNHLGWFWNMHEDGRDVLADACARRLVDDQTYRQFGAAPLRYYYEVFDAAAGERIGLRRVSGRARELAELSARALERYARQPGTAAQALLARPTPWFDRALAPTIAALLGGAVHQGFVNVPNGVGGRRFIETLPDTTIVEVPVRITREVQYRYCQQPPAAVAEFLSHVATAEALAYEAARSNDTGLLDRALEALPLPITPEVRPALLQAALSPPKSIKTGNVAVITAQT